ncbi:DUF969 domain-containing protein [Cellulosilyticum sp. WCF-2]|uniref:DUF969 domain-containing protein n=1 Tax=Cellulosilyticum sp. WCF-2 TaxID=2497860 RepID=UPI000F8E40C9|nr:DUF969 domain-containing protein [Cellulosilyticum sp. WCF-2]QEH67875.1 DUF969 domain-containing protein [Cellulosilyticum sp. WCF-2]
MQLIGILVIVAGFILKLDTIAVVLTAGVLTGFLGGMNIVEILDTLGSTFTTQRSMALFLLILPIIGLCERYGLKERATHLIQKLKGMSAGRIATLYLFIREIAIAAGVKLGQAEFVRPLIEPMAQGAAVSKYGTVDEKTEEDIKAMTAAADNLGNFFAQNIFVANSGVLLIVGTLEELGYQVDALSVANAAIPVAVIALIFGFIQNTLLDKKIAKRYAKKEGAK